MVDKSWRSDGLFGEITATYSGVTIGCLNDKQIHRVFQML